MATISPLNKLSIMFSIWDPDATGGTQLVTKADQNYVWNNNKNNMNTGSNGGKSTLKLAIAGDSSGSLSGITVGSGRVTITFQSGTTSYIVYIDEDYYGTGYHKLDFSALTDTGYYELTFFDGYVQRDFTGFRAI